MNRPDPFLFKLYRAALRLYPSSLRLRYQDQMLQTVRDADAERSYSAAYFWLYLFADLLKSSVKERLLMIRQQVFAHPVPFYSAALGLILTFMGGASSLVFQQMLRRGANQPQIQMADSYASQLASGRKPEDVIPAGAVDLAQSLEPFVIFYNDAGTPVRATGYLNRTIPVPPAGVLRYVSAHGSEEVTWQPQAGVRIASVARRVTGANPGIVLTGRSLRVVEEQEVLFWKIVFGAWFVLVALLIAGAMFLGRARYPMQSASA
jgi:hypothetical protein